MVANIPTVENKIKQLKNTSTEVSPFVGYPIIVDIASKKLFIYLKFLKKYIYLSVKNIKTNKNNSIFDIYHARSGSKNTFALSSGFSKYFNSNNPIE